MKSTHQLLAALTVSMLVTALAATASAAVFSYSAILDGRSESPTNASPGTGFAMVDYDDHAHTLRLQISFSGLLGNTTAAHIHAPTAARLNGTAGIATTVPNFAGFPVAVNSGTYSNTLDLTLASSYNPAFINNQGGTTASAEMALIAAIAAGKAYVNIHTMSFPLGEIRGFPVPVSVPPRIDVIELFGTNQVLIHFETEADRIYTLEYSDTLWTNGLHTDTWFPLFVAPDFESALHYVVPDTRTNRHRFYRLQVTP